MLKFISALSMASMDEIAHNAGNNVNTIGFPGLGWVFNINETAFSLFGLKIQWYGIILALGICAAFLLFYRNATKKEGIDEDSIFNVALFTVPIAIIGARFFYVITSWDKFKHRSFLDMINIREGGIAIYGAIIFGLLTVLIYNKVTKKSALSMLDALAPAVMLGQIIGRWGNFVNAEAYGYSSGLESLPWRMWVEEVHIDGVLQKGEHLVHPTFLYESLWNLIGLVLIMAVLYRKKKFKGEIFCAYMGWYGLGRAFIECLRADSLYIVYPIKFSVFVGAVAFIAAIILAVVFYKKCQSGEEITEPATTPTIDYTEEEEAEELGEYDHIALAEQALLDGDADDLAAALNDMDTEDEETEEQGE